MPCKECGTSTPAVEITKGRCRACQRARWRVQKAASDARLKRYREQQAARRLGVRLNDGPELSASEIDQVYRSALKVIKAQRWSSEIGWRSTAALVVEAA